MKSTDRIKNLIHKNIDTIAVGVFMLLCFAYVMFGVADASDLPAHARGAQRMLKENRLFENNFLMYFIANLLSFFSGELFPIQCAIVVLISVSNTAKYVLVRDEFGQMYSVKTAKMASTALLFVYVIPVLYFLKIFGVFPNTNNMYLQYYVPNVWHNSTILCMMPFAITTYFLSVRQLKHYDSKRNGVIALFVVLGGLTKPSFFFIYGVAYPICMLARYGVKGVRYAFYPILAGCICVAYEFLTIYDGKDGSGVIISIMPLFTRAFWEDIILYFSVSMMLPTLFVLLYRKEIIKDIEFWFVMVMLVIALGISWCCMETGDRAEHGNFGWQVIVAMWFVYYYMMKVVLREGSVHHQADEGGKIYLGVSERRTAGLLVLYALHVVTGVVYLARFLITNNFY